MAKTTKASLRPTKAQRIIDLVAAGGIDVTPWSHKEDGVVENAAANPRFCYDWGFGGGKQPTVLCVWHTFLGEDGTSLTYDDNLRAYGLKLDKVADNKGESKTKRAQARKQARRARQFDLLVQRAFPSQTPVRLVLLVGHIRDEEARDVSRVELRSLDSANWIVSSYDDDAGGFQLTRQNS